RRDERSHGRCCYDHYYASCFRRALREGPPCADRDLPPLPGSAVQRTSVLSLRSPCFSQSVPARLLRPHEIDVEARLEGDVSLLVARTPPLNGAHAPRLSRRIHYLNVIHFH